MFAKIYERPVFGQMLLKIDAGEDGKPEVRWHLKPPGLGVCSFALGFEDTDEGWDAAERTFATSDEARADKAGRALFDAAGIAG